uniref:SCP domain-containing protein n=1 Tax=Strongyloides papillosus TaxID=174720 RepID=A0A0N5CAZ1_STREA
MGPRRIPTAARTTTRKATTTARTTMKKVTTAARTTTRKVTTTARTTMKKVTTTARTTMKKVTFTKPSSPAVKYIKMKYKLYRDINALRAKYFMPELKVDVTQSKELQKFAEKFIKGDRTLKPPSLAKEDLFYFCEPGEKYDPIKYWSEIVELLTNKYFNKVALDLFYTKLICKSSTHIGCGVYGGVIGIFTYCKITQRGKY